MVVIVGAGLAGLTVAEGLLKKGVKDVVVLERYPSVGGRVVTNRDPTQYEIGAGRIFHKHRRVQALIRRFKLHTFPISDTLTWKSKETPSITRTNEFTLWFQPLVDTLSKLPVKTLATHTIAQLLPNDVLPFLVEYPYWAELNLMRADLALESFRPTAEMGTQAGYVGIAEGLDRLTEELRDAVVKAGGTILTRYRVEDIREIKGGGYELVGTYGKKADATPFKFVTPDVVIATCRCSLGTFSVLKGAPMLKQLQTSPLTRIYAIYPPSRTTRRIWFDDIEKTVTDSPLRYVIPIDPKRGLIMISYTDGPADTKFWGDLEGPALQSAIQREVRRLFPFKDIPEPTYLKKHEWPSGCTYWTPGSYKVDDAIKKAMHPKDRKGLWVVGESVSKTQAWMEGALESAETLLAAYK